MAVGAPAGVGSSRNGVNAPNNDEKRIVAIQELAQQIRRLDLSSVPDLRIEYNRLKQGKDALGNPADPELIRSMEALFTAITRLHVSIFSNENDEGVKY